MNFLALCHYGFDVMFVQTNYIVSQWTQYLNGIRDNLSKGMYTGLLFMEQGTDLSALNTEAAFSYANVGKEMAI